MEIYVNEIINGESPALRVMTFYLPKYITEEVELGIHCTFISSILNAIYQKQE